MTTKTLYPTAGELLYALPWDRVSDLTLSTHPDSLIVHVDDDRRAVIRLVEYVHASSRWYRHVEVRIVSKTHGPIAATNFNIGEIMQGQGPRMALKSAGTGFQYTWDFRDPSDAQADALAASIANWIGAWL